MLATAWSPPAAPASWPADGRDLRDAARRPGAARARRRHPGRAPAAAALPRRDGAPRRPAGARAPARRVPAARRAAAAGRPAGFGAPTCAPFCLDAARRAASTVCATSPVPDERGRPLRGASLPALAVDRRGARRRAASTSGTGAGLRAAAGPLPLPTTRAADGARRAVGDPDAGGRRSSSSGAGRRLAAARPGRRCRGSPTRVGDGRGAGRARRSRRSASWLAACVPPEAGAVTRFARRRRARRSPRPARTVVRGDAVEALPERRLAADRIRRRCVCLVDAYVHVFLTADELRRLPASWHRRGPAPSATSSWLSLDPLVPLGPEAPPQRGRRTDVPPALARARPAASGVFGVRRARAPCRGGRARGARCSRSAHPGGAWLEWL